jgi:RNA recognition motif-containing protein
MAFHLKSSPHTTDTLDKRAYVGGLSKDITDKDLECRFSSFGVVSKIDIIRQLTGEIISCDFFIETCVF